MEAKELRTIARENLAGNWWLSVGVTFVAGLFGALLTSGGSTINFSVDEDVLMRMPEVIYTVITILGVVFGILVFVSFIIGGTVQLGYVSYLLKQHDKEHFEFRDLFSQFHRFGQGFAQAFLRVLYTFLWTLLLIIPGLIKSLSYAMTPFIMIDHPEMTANEAITASKELMDGHNGELFWLGLTFFGWSLLCALTLGIGNLFLNPYMNASYAAFYRDICKKQEVTE